VSLLLALLLAQSPTFTGTVPQPNAALDNAYACLRAGVTERFAANAPAPNADERWGWALQVAGRCEAQLNATADSKEAVALYNELPHSNISKREMLRSEALYFVDRLIREHYEARS